MNRNFTIQPTNNTVEVEVIEYLPRRRSPIRTLFEDSHTRQLENLQHATIVGQAKAAMAYSASQHAAALSMIEARTGLYNPRGAARCGAIADAYTIATIKLIKDGEKE